MKQQVLSAPRPFVKWAGGKRQLMPVLAENLPDRFGAYYEPFLGGGAVLYHVLGLGGHRCQVSDLNEDLILAYASVRDRPEELIRALEAHATDYATDPQAYYYSVRASEPRGRIGRASRLIFLNRTCFNGLYRVNSKGRFNVPLGRYANPNIANAGNIRAVSRALREGRVDISCGDFGDALGSVSRGDLVYLDPPYQPAVPGGFTSYTSSDFGEEDLRRLARLCTELDRRGAHVMLSNSDSDEVSSLFSSRWSCRRISAKRAINSDSAGRTGHRELLIKNY